jgi:hypothetical protein
VREQAFTAMRGFLEKLQKISDDPELINEFEAQVKIGGGSGLLNSEKVNQKAYYPKQQFSRFLNGLVGQLKQFRGNFISRRTLVLPHRLFLQSQAKLTKLTWSRKVICRIKWKMWSR